MSEPELIELPDRAAWRRWLSRNHGRGRGVWLVIHKQGATTGSLSYEDAVREALCFGWIDSTTGSIDGDRYRQWMAPRKRGSGWAATNKARIEELEAEGLIAAAGREAIERAKADGSWNALDRIEALEIPPDLLEAFERHDGSRANWDRFPPSARKMMLSWIEGAKRAETRAKRVEETASRAARNERAR